MAFILFSLWFILNIWCASSVNIFGPQPKIVAEDGHLYFRAAKHRNIAIETKGRGKVQLNGVDLSNAAQLIQSASNILNKYTTNFRGSFTRIDGFDTALNGRNGVFERLVLLEAQTKNFTSTAGSALSNPKLTRLTRQLKATQDSLKSITALLTKDECQSNPCVNGGICQDLFNGFVCHCSDEWEGRLCDTDVNECARFVGTDLGCQNGATCINKRGSYQCLCANGWFGIHCTRRSKDCNTGSSSELCGHGTCISQNTEHGYTCICDQGWTTDGSSPECSKDVDECKTNRPPCSVNPLVTCENTPGSFRCGSCPPGYTGNGYYCSDINECEVFNGGCSMNPSVECINTVGSRKCGLCPAGYIGNGVMCSYRGVCNVNNGGCHPLATCRDYPRISSTFVECACPPGYLGSGVGLSGCIASTRSPCSPNPCKNNGQCIVNGTSYTGYTCRCKGFYFGRNCDQSINSCANNPCKNGASCVNVGLSFKCMCTSSWTGPTCSTERSACGGVLQSESGSLKYPPLNYPRSAVHSCAWIIETSRDKILNITFKSFHLKYTAECNKDWVQIHDGRNSASHMLGRFCGNDLPKNGSLTSTHNNVYIWFRWEFFSTNSGFELYWNSTAPTCDFKIGPSSTHGSIQSPGSPGNYPNNRDCFWSIAAPPGKRLLFHFFSFNIGSSVNCSKDYLEFIPSLNQASTTTFARFCNSSLLPAPLYSPGSEVVVHFHSDENGQYPGFQISYSVTEGIPGCGGVFTSDHGEMQSPSFQGKYLSDLSCEYKIKLSEKLRIKLEFISFEVENDGGCKFDYVEIYEGPDTSSPVIGRYCGTKIPAPYTSNGNEITVLFKTDWAAGFGGFVLRYETVCGGKYTAPSGIIESDGYPVHYKAGLTCLYEIVQPEGHFIELSFSDFELEFSSDDGSDRCYDFLEIRDGDNENSTLIGKYCDLGMPPLIVSSFNYLWMKFESDESVGSKGFRANYTTSNIGCGGILKNKLGAISSPGTIPNKHCNWVIAAPPDSLIQLTWITFQIEQRFQCDTEYVLVYENNTSTGKGNLIGKYCGHKLPPSALSASNIVSIFFKTDKFSISGGFTLSYNFVNGANVCGGNFLSPGGVIRSPGYPKRSSTTFDCTWTITVEHGHQIMLNVSKFEMQNLGNCKYDWLEIRNGKTASSPLIGRFCGKNIPKTISSHANQLYLHFKTDTHGFQVGFEIFWESAATGCGGLLTAPAGSIISPMYPESYNKYTDCSWKIAVSAGSSVQIIFTDIDLEIQKNCLLDFVELFDGNEVSAKPLGRYCGTTHPPVIRSTQNHVFVHFKSDISFEGRGFQLQYTTVCQNNVTGFYGVIESLNFPNLYPVDQDCNWNIIVESGNKINITFSHFDVRERFSYGNRHCNFSHLEIKYAVTTETDETTFESYGRYCGSEIPKMMTLNYNHVQIRYVADTSMIGTGFRLEWALEGCGGKLYKEGSLMSPNYPKGYPESTVCKWVLEADLGSLIEISFIDVDTERINNCEYDSVQVFNGPDNTYSSLGHFCHQDKPIEISSIGNIISVYFTSDVSYQGRGFNATFKSVRAKCGGKMTLPKGTIFSPNYPKNYDKNDTCEWLLQTDENHLIDLEFEDVQLLQNEAFCRKNYVKVYDGPSTAYPVLATICGVKNPNRTITSTHNTLTVVFSSYYFMTTKGFKANFHKACGARIVASENGNIQMHPSFVDIEHLENCSWTILAPEPNQHVTLTINHMNTPNFACDLGTYPVSVYNGENSDSNPIGQYCGNKVPPTITSSGNALHISVSSDMYFFATYTAFSATCGGTLTSFEGNFANPGYPGSYPSQADCEWTLHVAPGNHISLNFQVFDIPRSKKCETDFLEIRQNNSSGPILGIYCGNDKPDNITNRGSLWIYFRSSNTSSDTALVTAKGFIAEYVLDHNNVINAPSGQIGNPLYPDYFWAFAVYNWKVSVTFGKKISFVFKEINLESYNFNDCLYSGLKIYDGLDNSAPLLKSLCGFNPPDPVKTTSNTAFIEADLNSVRVGAKFLIEWQEIDSYIEPSKENTTISGCGSKDVINISDLRNYTLKSPGFPHGYSDDMECEWIFSSSSMNHLTIAFETIDLETPYYGYHSGCYFDYIEISSGKDGTQNWNVIKKICNHNDTDVHISAGNLMKVKFASNHNGNNTGFLAEVREECGGNIHESEGFIIFDEKHTRGRKCEWNITVRAGRTIKIDFPVFNIAPGQESGCKNYLTLRNGLLPDSPLVGLGQYCGTRPPHLNTTGNQLYVKYVGLPKVKGFTLHFKEMTYDCGGTVTLNMFENASIISSPNYPNIPSPHIECVWIIRSPPGTAIQLDFQDRFDLTPKTGCTSEAVEIRNGATEFSPAIGRFCNAKPSTQYSTDNMMYVKFFTNVDDPRNGFKAEVSLATCGGTLRGTTGKLQWSSMNRGLLRNQNCTWHIVAPEDYYLTIKFEQLSLILNYMTCSNSMQKLSVYSVNNVRNTETLVKTICSNFGSPDLIINGNEAIVRIVQGKITPSVNSKGAFTISYTTTRQNCTFNLNTASGIIKSPGYPRRSYAYKNCKWTIKVPEGRRISLKFFDLDLDETQEFQNEGIAIFDVSNVRVAIAFVRNNNGSFNGPKEFKSSSNSMIIYYWSMNSHGMGFYATYSSQEETVCKGSLNERSGSISLPNESTFICSWKRYTPDFNTTLKASFRMHLASKPRLGAQCHTSGAGAMMFTEGPRLLQFELCSNTTSPAILRTSYPKLDLQVWGGKRLKTFNFSLDYNTYDCGGLKSDEMGSIFSPNFPKKPDTSFDCSWLLVLPEEQQINVTFSTFDLGDDCDKSFVEIFNGRTPKAPRIGKYCKDDKPGLVISQKNVLIVDYHFSKDSKGKGFNLTYQPIIEGCGGIFHDRTRVIRTPDYGKNYPNNAECVWEIRAPEGNHIGLSFIDRFHLEESEGCVNDFLMVWDWKNEGWSQIKKLCGRETPAPVNSTGNKMRIMFRSNDKIQARGFKAIWHFNCGGTFEATNEVQNIVSPGYPRRYPNNIKCEYTIKAPSTDQYVSVRFSDFELEHGMPRCESDNVTIKALSSYYSPLSRTVFCDDVKPPDDRYREGIKITFISDSWTVRRGFRFSFNTDGCGGNITSPTKIHSKKFKLTQSFGVYYGRMKCQWTITAPKKKIIILRFESLRSPYSPSCSFDNIVVYDGIQISNENKLATLCGNLNNSLPTIPTPNNTATILSFVDPVQEDFFFTIDVFFSAGPSEGCGGTFNLTSKKIIQSPNIDELMDCNWNFIAPTDNQLEIEITDLNLSKCRRADCDCNFLELRDGGTSFSPQIKKICDSSNFVSTKYITSSRYGFLRYRIKEESTNSFRLSVKPIISKCGKSILNVTSELKTLISPNYPEQYPENLRCAWILKSEDNSKKFVLKFKDFEMSDEGTGSLSDTRCKFDYLEIEDGNQLETYGQGLGQSTVFSGRGKTSIRYDSDMMGVHTFCGRNDKPFDYYTSMNAVTLIFESKYGANRGRGFKLDYQLIGCNQNYSSEFGKIRLTLEDEPQDCIIGVTVPANKTIALYFALFYSSFKKNCTDDSMTIIDGDIKTGTQVGKWCGYELLNPVFSTTNKLWLKFHSVKDYTNIHLFLVYTSTDKGRGCGGSFYDVNGRFTSPMFPNDYRKDTICTWDVRGPPGSRLSLRLSLFDIQAACDLNYVNVTTYDNGLGNVHKFCKGDTPAALLSDGKVTVTYQSSVHNGGSGWVAEFTTVDNSGHEPS